MAPNGTEQRPWNDTPIITKIMYQTSSNKALPRCKNGKAVLYETKCYSQLVTVVSHGNGQTGTGGKPSTAMGDSVSFGCTEGRLLYMTIGCKERGDPSQGTFSHDTGEGWVQAKEGHYHDAIHTKHNTVKVMIFDDLGGATPGTAKTIKGLAKNALGKGARDATD
jgi:hypothetical protein